MVMRLLSSFMYSFMCLDIEYIHDSFSLTDYFEISLINTHLQANELSHLSLNNMAAISQKIFSDAFSWMKSFVFWLKRYW